MCQLPMGVKFMQTFMFTQINQQIPIGVEFMQIFTLIQLSSDLMW